MDSSDLSTRYALLDKSEESKECAPDKANSKCKIPKRITYRIFYFLIFGLGLSSLELYLAYQWSHINGILVSSISVALSFFFLLEMCLRGKSLKKRLPERVSQDSYESFQKNEIEQKKWKYPCCFHNITRRKQAACVYLFIRNSLLYVSIALNITIVLMNNVIMNIFTVRLGCARLGYTILVW